jgi:hypothetical protein
MFEGQVSGVVIAGSRFGVRLSRVGPPNLGHPTLIDVHAGRFVGSVRDDVVYDYRTFREELGVIYDQLTGTATLGGEVFNLALVGDGLGHLRVSVAIVDACIERGSARLTFEFEIDQTYLPNIINGIGREFLDQVHQS